MSSIAYRVLVVDWVSTQHDICPRPPYFRGNSMHIICSDDINDTELFRIWGKTPFKSFLFFLRLSENSDAESLRRLQSCGTLENLKIGGCTRKTLNRKKEKSKFRNKNQYYCQKNNRSWTWIEERERKKKHWESMNHTGFVPRCMINLHDQSDAWSIRHPSRLLAVRVRANRLRANEHRDLNRLVGDRYFTCHVSIPLRVEFWNLTVGIPDAEGVHPGAPWEFSPL